MTLSPMSRLSTLGVFTGSTLTCSNLGVFVGFLVLRLVAVCEGFQGRGIFGNPSVVHEAFKTRCQTPSLLTSCIQTPGLDVVGGCGAFNAAVTPSYC